MKTTFILRNNGRADRARELLQAQFLLSSGEPEDQVESLLDELEAAFGDDRRADFLTALGRLSRDRKAPVVVRVSTRDRHTQALRDDEHPKEAEAMLSEALAAETAEFPRCRAAMKLAEILADDFEKPDDAVKLLDQLRLNLKRRDLINKLREASDRYRKQADGVIIDKESAARLDSAVASAAATRQTVDRVVNLPVKSLTLRTC